MTAQQGLTRFRQLPSLSVAVSVFALGALTGCGTQQETAVATIESSSTTSEVVPDEEEHLLDEGSADVEDYYASDAGETEGCTGSGCSDDGEFIGGPTVGDVAREQAAAAAAAPQMVEVPSLVGYSPDDAAYIAERVGLRLMNGGVGSYGVVASQTPRAGSQVSVGTSILISVDYSAG